MNRLSIAKRLLSTNKHNGRNWSWAQNKKKVLLGMGITGGIVLYNTNDTAKHTMLTLKRSSVVIQATVRCFYHYKRTLNRTYKDEEQRQAELGRCHKRCALITLHSLQQNGGIFIKFGQHIGAMTYLLPPEWTETMIPLQDQCPESTFEDIDEMFQHDLGMRIEEMFQEFDKKPIGVASLAQVYRAKLRSTGAEVAVKCQHPELKEFIPTDMLMTKTVFWLMDRVFPEYPLSWVGKELKSSIYVELDFVKEAQNAKATARYFNKFKKLTALKVPKVYQANKRILIMEYVEGHRLDDLNYLDKNKISRAEVSSCLSHIFNNMIFTPNVGLHCDPHGGNLAIRYLENTPGNSHNFEIILFDHGLYRHPSTQLRRDYAKFWLALLDRDQTAMKLYAKRFANITDDQFPLFAATITGRDIHTALNYDINKRRSRDEIQNMAEQIIEGTLLSDLMSILNRVPRIVLLILKTNDLTRYLDESLQSPLGPASTFLIMTQYCAKTVFQEQKEILNRDYSRTWKPVWWIRYLRVWLKYEMRCNQLLFYNTLLYMKQLL